MMDSWTTCGQPGRMPMLSAGVFARMSETYDDAKFVLTQVECGPGHAWRRG